MLSVRAAVDKSCRPFARSVCGAGARNHSLRFYSDRNFPQYITRSTLARKLFAVNSDNIVSNCISILWNVNTCIDNQ